MFFKNNDNKLTFLRNYIYSSSYSTTNRYKIESLDTILKYFRKSISTNNAVTILSKFNNVNYAVFDLDDEQKLKLFIDIFDEDSYIVFQSSEEHYWGILDKSFRKLSDIFEYHNWKICNDSKYVSFCYNKKQITIRGLYETKNRKPFVCKTHGELSDNFKKFVTKLEDFYDNEAFELSVLRYRDPEMLVRYNRKLKMKNLKNIK